MKKVKNPLLKRLAHIPRVSRLLPLSIVGSINTIEGEKTIVRSKRCSCCKTMQPLDNYYARSEKQRKNKTEHELVEKDMENMCITCWDIVKPIRRKNKRNSSKLTDFFTDV